MRGQPTDLLIRLSVAVLECGVDLAFAGEKNPGTEVNTKDPIIATQRDRKPRKLELFLGTLRLLETAHASCLRVELLLESEQSFEAQHKLPLSKGRDEG